ncbi:acyl-coenzyme A diphosphatase NUDT19-like [Hippopotamus amphibius kiboko]|uniref:acyl-coenzyme A diphosphatase NUDT19-like n=1 Tax=Hippopotamus amphibius kiboko TaxID=575201 RepID=UPI002597717D|nr:acyl-coenzyme A diphosphatase NUDT19-like [Hippopotamus amphibius kiboko]
MGFSGEKRFGRGAEIQVEGQSEDLQLSQQEMLSTGHRGDSGDGEKDFYWSSSTPNAKEVDTISGNSDFLLRPRGPGPPAPELGRALAPPPALDDWRARVRRDPQHFLRLCAHLDCTPDIWALHERSAWLTQFTGRGGGRCFETTFFLCCLREPRPPVFSDLVEVVGCQWSSPSEATESFISKEIWFAVPQFYEIRRLENFASLSDLHKFCLDRELEGVERLLPIVLLTADGMIHLLPGDEMYLEDSNFLENHMSTEKKIEEIMKESKKFHRVVLYSHHDYNIHVTVQSKYKHVYPKNYVVSKSRL